MTSESTLTHAEPTEHITNVLCKGCRLLLPVRSFLYSVDDMKCYLVRKQCMSCTSKSTQHYREHQEDIEATRQLRKRQAERVTCVCGVSIYAAHRGKHYQTKRHLTVAALLHTSRNNDALKPPPTISTATFEPGYSELTEEHHALYREIKRKQQLECSLSDNQPVSEADHSI